MTAADIDEQLMRYFAIREHSRAMAVRDRLLTLTDRELSLVKESAVMGYVQGVMAGKCGDVNIPNDAATLARVVNACISMPDLYPLLGGSATADEEHADDRR